MRSRKCRSRRRSDAELDMELGFELRRFRSITYEYRRKNTPQYQPGVTQYRPININVSIRIDGPGNDGPVKQTTSPSSCGARAAAVRVEVPVAVPQGSERRDAARCRRPLAFMGAIIAQMFTDPALLSLRTVLRLHDPGRPDRGAEPQSVLLPAPPAIGVIPPPASASAPRWRSRSGSRRPPKPRRVSRAQLQSPRSSSGPSRPPLRPAAGHSMSAAGFAPLNASDGRLGQLPAPDRRVRVRHCFADDRARSPPRCVRQARILTLHPITRVSASRFRDSGGLGRVRPVHARWEGEGSMRRIVVVVAAALGLLVSAGQATAAPGDSALELASDKQPPVPRERARSPAPRRVTVQQERLRSRPQPWRQRQRLAVEHRRLQCDGGECERTGESANQTQSGSCGCRAARRRSARRLIQARPRPHCRTPSSPVRATRTSPSGS